MTICICMLCGSSFEARTSYGLCESCWSRDKLREYDRWSSAQTKALKDAQNATLTLKEWLALVSDSRGLCQVCHQVPLCALLIVDAHQGLIDGNVVPACRSCAYLHHHGFDQAMAEVRAYLSQPRGLDESDEVMLQDEGGAA